MFRFSICKYSLCVVVCCLVAVPVMAEQNHSEVVFEDRFDRDLSSEDSKNLGNDWKLNTKEDHQFVLQDGALRVTRNLDAKHSANLLHKAEFRNGTLELRFKPEDLDDSFLVQVRDSGFKQVKQGMLFNIQLEDGLLELRDAVVSYRIKQEMRSAQAANPSPEQQAELDKGEVSVPMKLSVGQWHDLLIKVQDETLTVSMDGAEAASLSSEAIAHATKDNFRVEVRSTLVIDDVKVAKVDRASSN